MRAHTFPFRTLEKGEEGNWGGGGQDQARACHVGLHVADSPYPAEEDGQKGVAEQGPR